MRSIIAQSLLSGDFANLAREAEIMAKSGADWLHLSKVSWLREKRPNLDIGVDGGISENNISDIAKAGANVIVSGSGIFGSDDYKGTIEEMRNTFTHSWSQPCILD